MAPKSAAKQSQQLTEVEQWFATVSVDSKIHDACGHPAHVHVRFTPAPNGNGTVRTIACPALPPAKQVVIDEAVAAAGGKPGSDFAAQVEAASGEAERKDRLRLAEENFDRRTVGPFRAVIPLKQLRPMANNPRAEVGDVSALVTSIESNGFIGALNVREVEENVWEVWAGNRRLAAAKQAGLEEVPCDVYELTEVQALELNLTEQINRSDLTPLEEGKACRALMELSGYDVRQVADKLGQSASWVTKRVALVGVAPEVAKALVAGKVSLTVAQALASLPSQQAQAKALVALEGRPAYQRTADDTAEDQVAWLREHEGQPLRSATWKVTDADLVPEAGACSACPHNSANAAMPGLFDSAKATPTCVKVECFEDKKLAAWLAKTAKAKAAGAKVLSLGECKKLFARGNDLGSASRYVEASEKPPKDKAGRTWAELVADVPEEARPVLHLAQDNAGKLRELYVGDKALEAVAVHLKARWAKSVVEEAKERTDPATKAKREEAEKEARLISEVRHHVERSVINGVASVLASDGFTLPAARLMASRLGERALANFAEATGRKKLPKDWLENGATMSELLAVVWLDDAQDQLSGYDRFTDEFLALAKSAGANVDAMVKAQLATARTEAEKSAAK